MIAFWSSFAPAALITSIKKDLNLTKGQIADSNVAAVLGGVVSRLFIGKFMDTFGPRLSFLLCLWGTAPIVFAMSFVRNFTEYALCRFFMAWALATVIPCIQWTTNMYNGEIGGGGGGGGRREERERERKREEEEFGFSKNDEISLFPSTTATNPSKTLSSSRRRRHRRGHRRRLGQPRRGPHAHRDGESGKEKTEKEKEKRERGRGRERDSFLFFSQKHSQKKKKKKKKNFFFLFSPQPLFDKALIARGYDPNVAWRYSFYLPTAMHVFAGLLVFFFGQDMPDGSKLAVRRADAAAGKGANTARTDVGWASWRAAIVNYRTWVLTLVYAVTFGVEISIDNVLSRYFQTQFKLCVFVFDEKGGGFFCRRAKPFSFLFQALFRRRPATTSTKKPAFFSLVFFVHFNPAIQKKKKKSSPVTSFLPF
jgi:hypothetical protein